MESRKTGEVYLGERKVENEDNQGVRKLSTTFLEPQVSIQEKTCHLRNRRIPDGTYGGVRGRWVNYLRTQLLLDLSTTNISCSLAVIVDYGRGEGLNLRMLWRRKVEKQKMLTLVKEATNSKMTRE